MTELLTSAQMRAVEAAAIASGEVTGLELMERAGCGVVEAIFGEWPGLRATSHRAVVLCGPGNNGGDGFVVARLLKAWGWEVEVFLDGDPGRMPPEASVNHARWRRLGEVRRLTLDGFRRLEGPHTDIFVDALFGIGLSRQPAGEAAAVLAHMGGASRPPEGSRRQPARLVAIDVPTGLCADSGRVLAGAAAPLAHVRADLTVTFHAAKVGHRIADGPQLSGRVVVSDIGLRRGVARAARHRTFGVKMATIRLVEGPRCDPGKVDGQKYTHGHALILSGPAGRGGAARLAARGALRIGAGVVTVGCPGEAVAEHAARLDAIMLREVGDGAALHAMLSDPRINALCLGPGLGTDARAEGLVAAALAVLPAGPPSPSLPHEGGGSRPPSDDAPDEAAAGPAPPLPPVGRGWGRGAPGQRRAVVLDADALTLLAHRPALFGQLHDRCVLTPHAGEFARLFPDIAGKLDAPATRGPAYSKVDATREAAARAGCVVLYKGADTVVADPGGGCSINAAHDDRRAPWLATAGSGDVLAGFVAGLLARGFAPMQAAETAAWLHVECARSFGPGLIAEDLPEEVPKVFRALGL